MLPQKEVKNSNFSYLVQGVGLSARPCHYSDLLKKKQVPWLEFLLDNYLHISSPRYLKLQRLAQMYPVVFHCTGFNLGSTDPLDDEYLGKVSTLTREFTPAWLSDHLCFCGSGGHYSPDLLPIVYNGTTLDLIAGKIEQIISVTGVEFLVENVSAYVRLEGSTMGEEEFMNKLSDASGCGILLDVNNLYVNAKNYNFDPFEAFLKLPLDKVKQIHLAGHTDYGDHIIDTHSQSIQPAVLALFSKIIKELGDVPVTLERDDNIPSFAEMMDELNHIKRAYYG